MSPGNAILLNGVVQTANREIGVPGKVDDSKLLESLLKKTQEIAFVKGNGTVVKKPSHRGRHL